MLDQLVTDFADALFNVKSREIYAEEGADLEAIRKTCIHNGMIHPPHYVTEVGKYLVKRSSRLADARRESLLEAVGRAKLPLTDAVFGEVTALVNDFCGKQQHREVGFLANHTAHQPGLNNVSGDLKVAVIVRIQSGISDLMEDAKNKMNVSRYGAMLDARNNQAVYASALGKRWDVFISHASEDKESFVEPLAKALQGSGLNVWYDKTEITVGDGLRAKIDEGLVNSRFGVVVLSHSFFAKPWPKEELEGLFAREVNGAPGVKVILPVWHNIGADEIVKYSPMLAGRLAANSEKGIDVVVSKLRRAMGL